jgi:hypothetical protein
MHGLIFQNNFNCSLTAYLTKVPELSAVKVSHMEELTYFYQLFRANSFAYSSVIFQHSPRFVRCMSSNASLTLCISRKESFGCKRSHFCDDTKQKVVASWSALWLEMKAGSTATSRKRRGQARNGAITAHHKVKILNSVAFSPHANYTDRATAASRRS